MELTIISKHFELCIRTNRMYSVSEDKFLDALVAMRICKTVWSTKKGWRKLAAA